MTTHTAIRTWISTAVTHDRLADERIYYARGAVLG
jgi:hypothetical protein